jgi:hypothetical protein
MTSEALLHGASRKGARHAKFGEIEKKFFFAVLASWREKHFIGKSIRGSLDQLLTAGD